MLQIDHWRSEVIGEKFSEMSLGALGLYEKDAMGLAYE